jgi:hypothetical protein
MSSCDWGVAELVGFNRVLVSLVCRLLVVFFTFIKHLCSDLLLSAKPKPLLIVPRNSMLSSSMIPNDGSDEDQEKYSLLVWVSRKAPHLQDFRKRQLRFLEMRRKAYQVAQFSRFFEALHGNLRVVQLKTDYYQGQNVPKIRN